MKYAETKGFNGKVESAPAVVANDGVNFFPAWPMGLAGATGIALDLAGSEVGMSGWGAVLGVYVGYRWMLALGVSKDRAKALLNPQLIMLVAVAFIPNKLMVVAMTVIWGIVFSASYRDLKSGWGMQKTGKKLKGTMMESPGLGLYVADMDGDDLGASAFPLGEMEEVEYEADEFVQVLPDRLRAWGWLRESKVKGLLASLGGALWVSGCVLVVLAVFVMPKTPEGFNLGVVGGFVWVVCVGLGLKGLKMNLDEDQAERDILKASGGEVSERRVDLGCDHVVDAKNRKIPVTVRGRRIEPTL